MKLHTPIMTRGYTLRPMAKGCQGHQRTDEIDDQVECTSTSTNNTSEGGLKALMDKPEGKPGTVNLCPATPDTPRAAHNSPALTHDLEHQATKEDLSVQQYPGSFVMPTIVNTSASTTRYNILRTPDSEISDDIQEAHKCGEVMCLLAAIHIQWE